MRSARSPQQRSPRATPTRGLSASEGPQDFGSNSLRAGALAVEASPFATGMTMEYPHRQPLDEDRRGYFKDVATMEYAGQDTKGLGDIMRALAESSPGSAAGDQAILSLARLVAGPGGDPTPHVARLSADYQAYAKLLARANTREAYVSLNDKHAQHWGSTQQLRFGKYVGDVLGVDPVFGALLSPTGGLVGPGNESYSADKGSVSSLHGEAHDSFGYLQRVHDAGPGYMYATPERQDAAGIMSEIGRMKTGIDAIDHKLEMLGPLSGQASGFELWQELLQDLEREAASDPGKELPFRPTEHHDNIQDLTSKNIYKATGGQDWDNHIEHLVPTHTLVQLMEDQTVMLLREGSRLGEAATDLKEGLFEEVDEVKDLAKEGVEGAGRFVAEFFD